jgi:hypothetical protein
MTMTSNAHPAWSQCRIDDCLLFFQAEEKMRLLLAKNLKRLKFLDLKGAETDKIDKTRNLVKKLSTKIRISVRVITKVSKKINRIRDDELWPQINALVQGYAQLFRSVVSLV